MDFPRGLIIQENLSRDNLRSENPGVEILCTKLIHQ